MAMAEMIRKHDKLTIESSDPQYQQNLKLVLGVADSVANALHNHGAAPSLVEDLATLIPQTAGSIRLSGSSISTTFGSGKNQKTLIVSEDGNRLSLSCQDRNSTTTVNHNPAKKELEIITSNIS